MTALPSFHLCGLRAGAIIHFEGGSKDTELKARRDVAVSPVPPPESAAATSVFWQRRFYAVSLFTVNGFFVVRYSGGAFFLSNFSVFLFALLPRPLSSSPRFLDDFHRSLEKSSERFHKHDYDSDVCRPPTPRAFPPDRRPEKRLQYVVLGIYVSEKLVSRTRTSIRYFRLSPSPVGFTTRSESQKNAPAICQSDPRIATYYVYLVHRHTETRCPTPLCIAWKCIAYRAPYKLGKEWLINM